MAESFFSTWQRVLAQHSERPFIRVPGPDGGRALSYRANAFYRRATQLCFAFSDRVKLQAGDRIAVIGKSSNDLGLCLHAAWLGGLAVVPINSEHSNETIVTILNNCEVKAVVFPPDFVARLPGILMLAPAAKEWIYSGTSTFNVPGLKVHSLPQFFKELGGSKLSVSEDYSAAIGVIQHFADEDQPLKGAGFTQAQLLAAGKNLNDLLRSFVSMPDEPVDPEAEDDEDRLVTISNTLAINNQVAIAHSFIAPLFGGLNFVCWDILDFKEFWGMMRMDDSQVAIVGTEQLREIAASTKYSKGLIPSGFTILAPTQSLVDMQLVEMFQKQVPCPISVGLCIPEIGGLVSTLPRDAACLPGTKKPAGQSTPSSGVALPGVELMIKRYDGLSAADNEPGELCVRSDQAMAEYIGTLPGEAFFDLYNFLHTGLKCFLDKDEQERSQLHVLGPMTQALEESEPLEKRQARRLEIIKEGAVAPHREREVRRARTSEPVIAAKQEVKQAEEKVSMPRPEPKILPPGMTARSTPPPPVVPQAPVAAAVSPAAAGSPRGETKIRIPGKSNQERALFALQKACEEAKTIHENLGRLADILVKEGPFERTVFLEVAADRKTVKVLASSGADFRSGAKLSISNPNSPLAQSAPVVQAFAAKSADRELFGAPTFALAPIPLKDGGEMTLYVDCGDIQTFPFEARLLFRAVIDVLGEKLREVPWE